MYRIFLTLALIPIASALAATPFVSVGLAPSVSVFKYPTSTNRPLEYENAFVAVGGTVCAGLSGRLHEWYARFTWSNSEEAMDKFEDEVYISDVMTAYITHEHAGRWQDQRLAMGHRWLLFRSEQKLMVGFIGAGLSAGTALWRTKYKQSSAVFNVEEMEMTRDSFTREDAKYSSYSFGGSAELGGRVSINRNLFIEASTQLGINRTVFSEPGDDDGLTTNLAGTVIEPSVLVGIRWEMR
ncbi:MAG: hypothetical protein IPP40_09545 [bacterium]|nr:hypothetical protein [bacterium]